MEQLSRVLLHMDLVNSHVLLSCRRLDLHMPVSADGKIELGNLVVLRIVRVDVYKRQVLYKVQHFRHLTGVETILSAKRFFHNAVNNKLQSSHIFFSSKHPYGLCLKKLKHINEVATLAGSESFMLEEIITNTQTYKFGTNDLNFSICMNMETDETEKQTGI